MAMAKNSTVQQTTASNHKMLRVVFISLLLDLLAFTTILPLLPSLLDHYRMNDESGWFPYLAQKVGTFREIVGAPEKFDTVLFGGLLGSMFSGLQFLASPVVGGLSDVRGRKAVLIVTSIGVALSYLLWAVASNFLIFILARFVGGISKGNVSLSTAIVTDVSSRETRGRGMALIGMAFAVGFIVGPMIGAAFAHWSHGQSGHWYVLPASFSLCLATVNVMYIIFVFQETLPPKYRAKSLSGSLSGALAFINPVDLFAFKAVQKSPKKDIAALRQIGLIYFLFLFFYSGLEFTLTFVTHLRFGYTSMQQGKMLFAVGIVMAALQGGYVRRVPAGKERRVALWGVCIVIPSFIVIGLASSTLMLYIGLMMYAVASATVVPCLTTMASSYGAHDQKGTVMGIFRSLGSLARALGPVLASFAFWSFGPTVTYIMGGVACLLPCYMLSKHEQVQ